MPMMAYKHQQLIETMNTLSSANQVQIEILLICKVYAEMFLILESTFKPTCHNTQYTIYFWESSA